MLTFEETTTRLRTTSSEETVVLLRLLPKAAFEETMVLKRRVIFEEAMDLPKAAFVETAMDLPKAAFEEAMVLNRIIIFEEAMDLPKAAFGEAMDLLMATFVETMGLPKAAFEEAMDLPTVAFVETVMDLPKAAFEEAVDLLKAAFVETVMVLHSIRSNPSKTFLLRQVHRIRHAYHQCRPTTMGISDLLRTNIGDLQCLRTCIPGDHRKAIIAREVQHQNIRILEGLRLCRGIEDRLPGSTIGDRLRPNKIKEEEVIIMQLDLRGDFRHPKETIIICTEGRLLFTLINKVILIPEDLRSRQEGHRVDLRRPKICSTFHDQTIE